MPTPYPGHNTENRRSPLIINLDASREGFGYDHATEAIHLDFREATKLETTAKITTDSRQRDLPDLKSFKLTVPSLDTSFLFVRNAYLLGRGLCNIRMKNADLEYYNFDSTISAIMACGWTFELDKDKRVLTFDFETALNYSEELAMYDAMGSAGTGGASGSAFPMTAQAYDRAHYNDSGIKDFKVGGVSIGDPLEPSIKIMCVPTQKADNRGRKRYSWISCEGTIYTDQMTAADLKAGLDSGRLDSTITIPLLGDDEIQLVNGAVNIISTPEMGDSAMESKITFKGRIPRNPNGTEGAPPYFDCGVTDPAVLKMTYA
jgi:hypothetical protein